MKNKRILLISIPVIILISAAIGCAITFSSAPHAALARVFIDIGALFALVSITYSLPKPDPIHLDDIVDGLRDLARNRFDRRLPIKEHDELHQIRQAFNELAGTLSDSRDPSLTHIRYNPMHRVELKVTPLPNIHHSHHPELGLVATAPLALEEPVVETQPSMPAEIPYCEPISETIEPVTTEEHPLSAQILQSEAPPEPTPAPQRPETYPSGIGAADLFFLFERFKDAHDQPNQNSVDFDSFLSTVNKAREDLIRAYQCKDVKFEVVTEAGAVALRPRLVR